mmetsp:Transcript_12055/g.18367  ORF Transcript_12055/g.18367 Transcript_12055/m.18367 type:complete len:315 (-) Transcript_12055:1201-2145(-)
MGSLAFGAKVNSLMFLSEDSVHFGCIDPSKVNANASTSWKILVKCWDHSDVTSVGKYFLSSSNLIWLLESNVKFECCLDSKSVHNHQIILIWGSSQRERVEWVSSTVEFGRFFTVKALDAFLALWFAVNADRKSKSVRVLSALCIEINGLSRFSFKAVNKSTFGIKGGNSYTVLERVEGILWFWSKADILGDEVSGINFSADERSESWRLGWNRSWEWGRPLGWVASRVWSRVRGWESGRAWGWVWSWCRRRRRSWWRWNNVDEIIDCAGSEQLDLHFFYSRSVLKENNLFAVVSSWSLSINKNLIKHTSSVRD